MLQLGVVMMQSLKLSTRTRVLNLWRDQIVDHGTCPGFLSSKDIAIRLGISESRARYAMRRLMRTCNVEVNKKARPVTYRVIIEDGNGNEYLAGALTC